MELDQRKEVILEVVVRTYVDRAEPVGSEFIASHTSLGVRSATIRNELAEITSLGFLRQPHTSAGRVPSSLGYRYYVDRLMPRPQPRAEHRRTLRHTAMVSGGDVEELLEQTCRALSSLTQLTSVATPPATAEPRTRSASVTLLGPRKLLAVVVMDSGQVLHRFVELEQPLSPAEATRLSNILDAALRERSLGSLAEGVPVPEDARELQDSFQTVVETISRSGHAVEGEVVLEGTRHMLAQPEFRESDRVEPVIRLLEQRRNAYEALRALLAATEVTLVIGEENPHEDLRECSFVAARYAAGPRSEGWIGVLGPTRMAYDRALSAVQSAALALGEAFTRIGSS
jgi:heat-inducible transcriptional repressor